MAKMNPEVKALWIAALRSGKYLQGQWGLRRGNTFCCLGVLCDLMEPGGWEPSDTDSWEEEVSFLGRLAFPPRCVYDWAGLSYTARVCINGITADLQAHNDGPVGRKDFPKRSFAEIADAIEEQL